MDTHLTNKDLMIIGLTVLFIIMTIYILAFNYTFELQENYIQNLEFKLNVYEQSYDEFALKDAIEQGDSYE